MEEIETLKKSHPTMQYLYIEDETIGQNRRLWEALLPELRKTGLTFGANYRIGVAGAAFLEALREANFIRISVGVESGNEWIRRHVLNRRYSNEQIVETFRLAGKLGMDRRSYNLIGLPQETPAMFEDTVRINQRVRPNRTTLNIFYPYPGTALDRMCGELGIQLLFIE